jgi:hypothetical protein
MDGMIGGVGEMAEEERESKERESKKDGTGSNESLRQSKAAKVTFPRTTHSS